MRYLNSDKRKTYKTNLIGKLKYSTWTFSLVIISLRKKSYSSISIWVQFPLSPKYTCMSLD